MVGVSSGRSWAGWSPSNAATRTRRRGIRLLVTPRSPCDHPTEPCQPSIAAPALSPSPEVGLPKVVAVGGLEPPTESYETLAGACDDGDLHERGHGPGHHSSP